jgi:hypothetical protein
MEQLLSDPERLGVVGLLTAIVIGGWRRWYVWSWQFNELLRDRDFWRTQALRGTALAEKVADASLPPS